MKNYDQSVEINHNPNLPYIHDHIYRILQGLTIGICLYIHMPTFIGVRTILDMLTHTLIFSR